MAEDTETARPKISDAEKKARSALSKALWRADVKDQEFPDPEARKAAYKEARKTYRDKARIVAKQMERQGLSLILKSPE